MYYPCDIETPVSHGGHIQGIALDRDKRYLYCSFTTELWKIELASGRPVGSVVDVPGHIGCLATGPDGKIYGTLEDKSDAIGKQTRW